VEGCERVGKGRTGKRAGREEKRGRGEKENEVEGWEWGWKGRTGKREGRDGKGTHIG